MFRWISVLTLSCVSACMPISSARADSPETPKPINAMCPIGKEPIVPAAGTVEYKDKMIGLCCPGCGKQFLAWDEARKDAFVAMTAADHEPDMNHSSDTPPTAETKAPPEAWTDPYPFDTCPISGKKLGSMGEPVVKEYDGREVRFCCNGCVGRFEADLVASWKKVNEEITNDQLRYYPLDTCIVTSEPLTEDDEDIATNMVYGNRLVRLCCGACAREFKDDPKKFIDKLDKAAADAQRTDYPLDTCVVAGGKLGSMGEPTEMIVAGRLMRFCCASCEPKVKADPAKYIAAIDTAWQAKGRFTGVQHDADNNEHGHH